MPARSIVLAALAFFLPVLPAAQTVKSTAARAISKSKPDLSGQEAVIEKMSLVVRYTEDGSCVRTLVVVWRGHGEHTRTAERGPIPPPVATT